MESLTDFALREGYKRVAKLGDKLSEIEPLIDWDAFRPIVIDLFCNKTKKGGRPNIDEVVMINLRPTDASEYIRWVDWLELRR